MKSNSFFIFLLLFSFIAKAQSELETYPIFQECQNDKNQNDCFRKQLINHLSKNYAHPENSEIIDGKAQVLFEVDTIGKFNVIYINAQTGDIKSNIQKSFDQLPQIKPATYNGEPRYIRFTIPLSIPIQKKKIDNLKEAKLFQKEKKKSASGGIR